ncbi:MAG: hypothetical protein IJ874_09105 [Ruminococcus sp.]|nr:hypothetical protein [Ruminococcus sp.]
MIVNIIGGVISSEEKEQYINYIRRKYPGGTIQRIDITVDGEFVDIQTHFSPQPFDRIRRITGYLVGTLDRFNNGKRSEEHDRIKHSV